MTYTDYSVATEFADLRTSGRRTNPRRFTKRNNLTFRILTVTVQRLNLGDSISPEGRQIGKLPIWIGKKGRRIPYLPIPDTFRGSTER